MPQAVYPEVDSGSEPIRASTEVPSASCLTLLPMGFAKPVGSPRLLVSSYLTFSPLPPLSPVGEDGGGLLSAALAVTVFTAPRRYLASYPKEPGLSSD